jgi:DNA-binding MarR family transcriptional regulator
MFRVRMIALRTIRDGMDEGSMKKHDNCISDFMRRVEAGVAPGLAMQTDGAGELGYDQRILIALRRIIRAVDIYSRKLNTLYNVTGPQMVCLFAVVRHAPLTLSELAKEVHLGGSTVNGIVDRLEQKGWVERKRDHVDRRKVYLWPTLAGRQVVQETPSLLQDKLAKALMGLAEAEQAQIARSLEQVVNLLDVGHIQASPHLIIEPEFTEKERQDENRITTAGNSRSG